MKSLRITRREAAKVTHDINNVWHSKYKDVEIGFIHMHSNRPDSPSYVYTFINHVFDNYEFHREVPDYG